VAHATALTATSIRDKPVAAAPIGNGGEGDTPDYDGRAAV